ALAGEGVEALAHHGQSRHQADLRPLGRSDARDGADQVVLEQPLALRRDVRQHLLALELAHRGAEIELLARHQLLRVDTVELRRVLLLGVGLGVVALDDQVRAGDALELAHQVLDPLGEAAQRHRHRFALRDVELEAHRRLQVAQHLLRAIGKGVELAVGEVGDAARHAGDEVVRGDENQQQGNQPDRRIDQVLVFLENGFHPPRCPRMTTPVANSAKAITERKNPRSRASITPRWKPSKWVTTEKAAMVSTNAGLPQRASRSVTGLKPARIRNRQITTDRISATTWLRVIAEVMQVMARYAPARSRLPK